MARSSALASALRRALHGGHTRLAAGIAGAVIHCQHWTPGPVLTGLIVEAAQQSLRDPCPEVAAGVAAGAFFAAERGDLARAREWGALAVRWAAEPSNIGVAWLALGVASLYSGDLAKASACFRHPGDDGGFHCEAHASLALIDTYSGDLASAREHVRLALALAPWVSDASHAFVHYVAGEVALQDDPAEGVRWLRQAAAAADRIGAEQVLRVARVALFAVLARGERPQQALEVGSRLLVDLRRRGTWTQTWTPLRVVAELLARLGRSAEAAFVLAAAALAPSAPRPSSPDLTRYTTLAAQLSAQLGAGVQEEIERLARSTPRARVLARAERLLEELRRSAPSHAEPAAT